MQNGGFANQDRHLTQEVGGFFWSPSMRCSSTNLQVISAPVPPFILTPGEFFGSRAPRAFPMFSVPSKEERTKF